MRHVFFLLFGLLVTGTLMAQNPNTQHLSFKKMAKERSRDLHTQYPKVGQVKFASCKSVQEQHDKVDKAWHDFWHNISEYYHQNGLEFDRPRKLYVHLHFAENGHLDYFGYHFIGKEGEKEKRFVELVKAYTKDHAFGLSEGVKFSQCGMIHLLPRIGVKEGE